MRSPITNKEMKIVKEVRKSSFRKEEFEIVFHAYKCEDTGELFEDENFAHLNYNQVINKYREKHSIPSSKQIAAIRQKYKLSAIKMSEILGFGANTYRQYEADEVPSVSNANLINLIENPHEFYRVLEKNKKLDESFKNKLSKKVEELMADERKHKHERCIIQYLFGKNTADAYTGYKQPDLEKMSNMILFFAEKTEAWKTKLNKLLFYSDFAMYSKTAQSISGTKYAAINLGPVPNKFNSIYDFLHDRKDIIIENVFFSDGATGSIIKCTPQKSFNADLFSSQEIKIMNLVAEKFRDTTSKEIIEISHNENAWKANCASKSLIDYKYGFELKAI